MSKVIPFPIKRKINSKISKTVLRRKWAFAKINAIAKTIGLKLLYYFRIVLANITHYALCYPLVHSGCLKKTHLGYSVQCQPDNLSQPESIFHLNRSLYPTVFIALSLFSMLGDQIADLINLHTPFHHLFKCNKKREQGRKPQKNGLINITMI